MSVAVVTLRPPAGRLLGGHVAGRAEHRARYVSARSSFPRVICKAEIRDKRAASGIYQDVGRFQVPVRIFPRCANRIAWATAIMTLVATRTGMGPLASCWLKLPPSTNFMLKYCRPSCSPTS